MIKRKHFTIAIMCVAVIIFFGSSCDLAFSSEKENGSGQPPQAHVFKKLYWFIPDGMRADPYLFDIYKWAREGKLPNIKYMMENGTYGYCKPVFPGHTPINFASLVTGSYPEVHGIADGPMHTEGNPLSKPSIGGFRSTSKLVEPIWLTLEKQGKTVGLLSIPGSTPPELEAGYTIQGRWGGWGADFFQINFEAPGNSTMQQAERKNARLFFSGPPLVKFPQAIPAHGWKSMPRSFSPAKEVLLTAWDSKIYAYLYDSTNDNAVNYDRVAFSQNKENVISDLKEGQWSDWSSITLTWNDIKIGTAFKIKVIKLGQNGFYRIRFLYNNLNETLTKPTFLAKDLVDSVGPMVDFVDSFPPQLIYYDEDKITFLEEAEMSFEWHQKMIPYFLRKYDPDVFLHSIYTPNQLLTSRWWLGYIDPQSDRFNEKSKGEKDELWEEVFTMYKKIDDMVGEYLKNSDKNTIIVLSSDHGAAPLNKFVHLNNLFSRKGWLKFRIDGKTGEAVIDWENSKVVYLNFSNIYISPEGLHNKDGNWNRSRGPEYEILRDEVIRTLLSLKDENGIHPVAKIAKWEGAEKKFRLPHKRVGDLVIANRAGYGWNEEMSEAKELFSVPLITGYKQSILSDDCPATWTPFIVMGPGVKRNHFLGKRPISMIDQYPTLMRLMGAQSPNFVQGKSLKDVFASGDE